MDRVLWAKWWRSRSWLRRNPAVASLIPYLLGCVLWRVGEIRWEWWERERQLLPWSLLLAAGLLWVTKPFWRRWLLALWYHPLDLILPVLLMVLGYGYIQHAWNQTHFPFASEGSGILQIEGRILRIRGTDAAETWTVRPVSAHLAGDSEPVSSLTGKIEVVLPTVLSDTPPLCVGDRVILTGQLQPFRRATNPGQFDYERYQRYQRFIGQMREPTAVLCGRRPFDLSRWLDEGRSHAARFFTRYLSSAHQPLVMSLLTGDTDYLAEQDQEQIRMLGLSHILAISGLHLGIIVLILKKLLLWVHLPRRLHPFCQIAGIWLAVLFVGCQPSALRVGTYLTFAQCGQVLRRPLQPLNLLGAAAWVILLLNPLSLFLISFQLSFTVYLAILLFYPLVICGLEMIRPRSPQWMYRLWQSFAISLVAFLASMPLILYHFFQVPFQGIVMNLWAVPLAEIMIVLIMGSLLLGSLFSPLGRVVLTLLDGAVGLFYWLVHGFAQLCPWVWQPGRPLFIWLVLPYMLGGITICRFHRRNLPSLWRKRERRLIKRIVIMLVVFLLFIQFLPGPAGLEWILLDVGQGDGMFFRFPRGQVMMVDGGGQVFGDNYVGESIVRPFLLSRGIRTIDLVCITHFDADHVRGLLPFLRQGKVKAIWAPAGSDSEYAHTVARIAEERRIPVYHPVSGDTFAVGGVEIEVLNPQRGQLYPKENDRSITLRMAWGGFRFLLTGDLGESGERQLLRQVPELEAEILKVGHHGSKYSTTAVFLHTVAPRLALISVGANHYGHPASETIERLKQQGTSVIRTDKAGAIQVNVRDGKIHIHSFNNIRHYFE